MELKVSTNLISQIPVIIYHIYAANNKVYKNLVKVLIWIKRKFLYY